MPATVTFLLGRAGSGKTEHITRSLRACMQAGQRAVLLTPEQFTYEAEARLCRELGGLLGIQVLSMTRLCERALAPAAMEQGRPFLSRQGRCMVFRRSAWRVKSKLTAFAPVAGKPGFAERLDALFSMCKRFAISPEDLRAAGEALPEGDPLRDKLQDLALLFADAQDFLVTRYLDGEDAVSALLPRLPDSFLAGAQVYIDGLDLPTGQLFALLSGIMEVAAQVTIALCLDPDPAARDAVLFAPEQRTYARLREIAQAMGCTVKIERLRDTERTGPVAHLSREVFAQPQQVYPGPAPQITVYCAAVRAEEAEALGDAILRMARQGMRYRDMAVIAGDMAAYVEPVQRALARRGVPVFLDARREMLGHPAVELIEAAVKAAGGGFSAMQVLRVAKTGLARVDVDGCELLENHILARGLRGGRQLTEPFCDVTDALEQARAALLKPLQALRDGLIAQDTAAGKAGAVRAYLVALGVEAQLAAQAEELRIQARHALAQEHEQVWDVIEELLSQLEGILGDVPMQRGQFAAVLTEAFSTYQVGVIPATADQVLFGTLTRTRSRPVRALFVLGCNEGILPAAHADDGLIDDAELGVLRAQGLAPWGDSAVRAENERLDLYQALGKAREQVWLSYPCSNGKSELLPSSLIHAVSRLFPRCTKRFALDEQGCLPESREAGFAQLISALREQGEHAPGMQALLDYYRNDPAYAPRLEQAMAFRDTPVSPPAFGKPMARRVYGAGRLTTVSRLQTYNACPYQYFMRYGVRAHPRREFRERTEDRGSFCHLALERFAIEAKARGWAQLTPESVDAILDAVLPTCLRDYRDGMLVQSPRTRAMAALWMEVVRQAAHAICRQITAGTYRPIGNELRFGPGETFPAMPIPLPDGSIVEITGVIDRVDIADAPEGTLLRVVDYKAYGAGFSYEDLVAGVQLQLPLYLAALQQAWQAASAGELAGLATGKPLIPAGLFYQPVKDAPLQADTPEKVAQAFRLTGVLLDSEVSVKSTDLGTDRFSKIVYGLSRTAEGVKGSALMPTASIDQIIAYAKERAAKTYAAVLEGEIPASPIETAQATTCAYCDYRSVCRFETALPGCTVRRKPVDAKKKFE